MILTNVLNIWLDNLTKADYAPTTIARYGSAIRRFLQWYDQQEQRPAQLADLTPIALVNYRTTLQHNQSTATTNVHIAALRAWCLWLADQGYLSEDPTDRLKSISQVDRDAPEPLSNQAVNALLRAAHRTRYGKRDYAICQVLLQTGMRLGECQALAWQDIVTQERKAFVLIRSGKGDKARTIPLNGSVRSALVEYVAPILQCEAKAKIVAAAWPVNHHHPLWQSQKGSQLSTTAIWRMFKQLVIDCASRGLVPADTTTHHLRHTFAHHYLAENPGDLVGLARLLGHKNLNTTKIYTQPTFEELTTRVDQMPLNAYA